MQIFKANNLFNKIKNSIKYFFITISILLFCFVIFNLEGIDGNFNNFFDVINAIGSVIISIGLLKIGIEANKIAKEQQRSTDQKISQEEREIIRENYKNLMNGISTIYNNYRNIREINKGEEILRQVANQAKLELPKDLEDYTQEVYELAKRISMEVKKENNIDESFDKLHNFFSANIIYSKYLKNPNKN